jgi:hypothetical protein
MEQFQNNADDEQIVRVGEKAHTGYDDDAPLLRTHVRIIDF